ncbi:hypothetical protein TWF694_011523 [Orbilia ellipsospora]|uniref:Uncharacterized protein n=1 Tax=Orbilia ellipsospora TaxID=2528407 RepID=A0AAV9X5G3_9PEZI
MKLHVDTLLLFTFLAAGVVAVPPPDNCNPPPPVRPWAFTPSVFTRNLDNYIILLGNTARMRTAYDRLTNRMGQMYRLIVAWDRNETLDIPYYPITELIKIYSYIQGHRLHCFNNPTQLLAHLIEIHEQGPTGDYIVYPPPGHAHGAHSDRDDRDTVNSDIPEHIPGTVSPIAPSERIGSPMLSEDQDIEFKIYENMGPETFRENPYIGGLDDLDISRGSIDEDYDSPVYQTSPVRSPALFDVWRSPDVNFFSDEDDDDSFSNQDTKEKEVQPIEIEEVGLDTELHRLLKRVDSPRALSQSQPQNQPQTQNQNQNPNHDLSQRERNEIYESVRSFQHRPNPVIFQFIVLTKMDRLRVYFNNMIKVLIQLSQALPLLNLNAGTPLGLRSRNQIVDIVNNLMRDLRNWDAIMRVIFDTAIRPNFRTTLLGEEAMRQTLNPYNILEHPVQANGSYLGYNPTDLPYVRRIWTRGHGGD